MQHISMCGFQCDYALTALPLPNSQLHVSLSNWFEKSFHFVNHPFQLKTGALIIKDLLGYFEKQVKGEDMNNDDVIHRGSESWGHVQWCRALIPHLAVTECRERAGTYSVGSDCSSTTTLDKTLTAAGSQWRRHGEQEHGKIQGDQWQGEALFSMQDLLHVSQTCLTAEKHFSSSCLRFSHRLPEVRIKLVKPPAATFETSGVQPRDD